MRHTWTMTWLALAGVAFGAPSARGADAENPYAKAKVGDWTEYESLNKAGGMVMRMTRRETVVKKTDTEVTLEMASKTVLEGLANAPDVPENKMQYTVKLNEKYDPQKNPAMKDATVKELGKGKETLTVKGKPVETEWVEVEMTAKMFGKEITTKSKTWRSPAVPLSGMVKMVTSGEVSTTQELKDFGSGK